MHCETTVGLMRLALKNVEGVIDKRSTLAVLHMIRLGDGRVEATDLDMTVSVTLATTAGEGAALVPYAPFARLMRACDPASVVTINQPEPTGGVVIMVEGGMYRMPSIALSEWPEPAARPFVAHRYDGDVYRDAIAFALPFVSREETRYYLNGVFLTGEHVVATDGHRLGHASVPGSQIPPMIVPTRVASYLAKTTGITVLHVEDGGRWIRFEAAGLRVLAKTIDGTYPDWTRVVPDVENGVSWRVPRQALAKAVARILAANPVGLPFVGLLFRGDALALGHAGADGGYSSGSTVAGCEGGAPGEFEIEINGHYLQQAVASFADADVRLQHKAAQSAYEPVIWCGDTDGQYVVQMPTRTGLSISLARAMLPDTKAAAA